jgi:hypothetical protein
MIATNQDEATDKLARDITYALIKAGHVHDSAFTAVSRLIRAKLGNDNLPTED